MTTPQVKTYAASPSTEIDVLTLAESQGAFTIAGGGTHPNCINVDLQDLYQDALGTTTFSHSQIWLDKNSTTTEHPLRINLATPTAAPVIFYLLEKSYGGSSESTEVKFDIMICGLENVLVTTGTGIETFHMPEDTGSTGFVVPVAQM